jgi:hypothetical protein
MPHASTVSGQNTRDLDHSEKAELETLLKAKIQSVPAHYIPDLTLADILDQTPRALHLPNIPPDIQLPFFLRNRATIDRYVGKPVKDEEKQSLDITRAIWFYRLDEAHQFQRFHDAMRWNTAIYVALLAVHSESREKKAAADRLHGSKHSYEPRNTRKDTYKPIPPAAIRFITQYLAAVIEHHNTPTTSFTARESFIRAWKAGPWELFTVFGGAQKKLMKKAMKVLSKEWVTELAVAEKQMGRERYEKEVGKFVGGLVPGRRDQGVKLEMVAAGKYKDMDGDVNMEGRVSKGRVKGEESGGNELLEALRSPYAPLTKDQHGVAVKSGVTDVEGTTVTDMRYAITAVQEMEPRDILPVLIRLFAE